MSGDDQMGLWHADQSASPEPEVTKTQTPYGVEWRGLKVGMRVVIRYLASERPAIIRGFQMQDWDERPTIIVDLDPPPARGPVGSFMGRRVTHDQIVSVGR